MIDLFGKKSRDEVLCLLNHIRKQRDLLEEAKNLIIRQQNIIDKQRSEIEFYKMAAGEGVRVVQFPHSKGGSNM